MKKLGRTVLLIALALGILASAVLLIKRNEAETSSRDVTAVMLYSDVCALSESSGESIEDWLLKLKSAGLHGVITQKGDPAQEILACGLETASAEAVQTGEENTLEMYFIDRQDSGNLVNQAYDLGITIVLTEDDAQMGADLTPQTRTAIEFLKADCLKCFRLIDEYASRYDGLGYDGPKEIENILYRAVTDRNVRVIWLQPFTDGGSMVTDVDEYAAVLENLEFRLARQNITMNGESSAAQYNDPVFLLLCVAALGICAAGVIFLCSFYKFKTMWQLVFLAAAFLVSAVGLYFMESMMISMLALAASIIFPCLAIVAMTAEVKRQLSADRKLPHAILLFISTLVVSVGISLMGGVFIGAIMSDSRYMLELEMFSGVKVSQLVPLAYAVFIIWRDIYHKKGRGIKGDVAAAYGSFKNGGRTKLIVIAVLIVLAAAVYIMRTGDGMLGVPQLELRARNALEEILYVRPRTKEMLIAYPAVSIVVVAAVKGWKNAVLPFGILAAVGFAGVCNTFCHIRADFMLSVTRTFIGLAMGLVLGIVLICILYLISINKRKA